MFKRLLLASAFVFVAGAAFSQSLEDRVSSLPASTPPELIDLINSEYSRSQEAPNPAASQQNLERVARLVSVAEKAASDGDSPASHAAIAEAAAVADLNALITDIPSGDSSRVNAAATQVVAASTEVAFAEATAERNVAMQRLEQAQQAFDRAERDWRASNVFNEESTKKALDEARQQVADRRIEVKKAIQKQKENLNENADWDDLPDEYKRRFKEIERRQQAEYDAVVRDCDERYRRWTIAYAANPVSPSMDLGKDVLQYCQRRNQDIHVKFEKEYAILDPIKQRDRVTPPAMPCLPPKTDKNGKPLPPPPGKENQEVCKPPKTPKAGGAR